jgi:hypothetical protein
MRCRIACGSVFADRFRNGGILRAFEKYCNRLRLAARVEVQIVRSSERLL